MTNHRDAYWRWLILGLRGLATMIVEQAKETPPPPELAEQLREHIRRLSEAAGGIK